MKRHPSLTPVVFVLILISQVSAFSQAGFLTGSPTAILRFALTGDTDRDRDGLLGPVRRIKTEMVKLASTGGKSVEGQRVVIEAVAYDIKGAKIENAYYPVPGAALTGKEVYKYDEKGNIIEMTMVNADGSLLSKEVYSYETDAFGNWTKMTTSIAVIEGGKISYEPTEVTYRSISYYLDEATLARMSQPTASPAIAQVASIVPSVASSTPGSNPSTSQINNTSRLSAPMPSGGALLSANISSSETPFSTASNGANDSTIKVDAEAPPPAEAKSAPKPLLKPISGGVLNGKAMSLPKPLYPPAARAARASGVIAVEVIIDERGKVISAKAAEGHSLLRGAAVSAAQDARFSPTLLSGQPVKVSGTINYTFSLQ